MLGARSNKWTKFHINLLFDLPLLKKLSAVTNLFTFIESHMLKCILVEEINIQKVKKLAENLNPPVRCLPPH